MNGIDMIVQQRNLIRRAVAELSAEQMLEVPQAHRNNILWNLGHIVTVQQLLHYRLCGQDLYVTESFCDFFRTGTSPADWSETPDIDEVMTHLTDLATKLGPDYRRGRFAGFQEYTTSTGVALRTIDDAIAFDHFHEGVHLGIILSLRKHT